MMLQRSFFRKPLGAALLAVTLACAVSSASSGNASASTADAQAGFLDIGAILPLTGDGGPYGPGMEAAIRIAVDEVNAAGGVGGKRLRLHVEDDATNPDQGVRAANKLIRINKVKAIIGAWASSVTLAIAPLTIRANIVQLNVSGSPRLSELQVDSRRTVFRVNATNDALAAVVARAFKRRGNNTITVMANSTDSTSAFGRAFAASFTAAGGRILDTITYPDKQPTYGAEVGRAVRTKPDLYLLSCFTPDAAIILRDAYQAGASGRWALPNWCLNSQLVGAVGARGVEGNLAFGIVPTPKSPAYKRLQKAYRAKTGKNVIDNSWASFSYDAVHLLALAVQQTRTTKARPVGRALISISNAPGQIVTSYAQGRALARKRARIDYQGASGPIAFNVKGDMTPNVGLFRVDSNGRLIFQTILSVK